MSSICTFAVKSVAKSAALHVADHKCCCGLTLVQGFRHCISVLNCALFLAGGYGVSMVMQSVSSGVRVCVSQAVWRTVKYSRAEAVKPLKTSICGNMPYSPHPTHARLIKVTLLAQHSRFSVCGHREAIAVH